MNVDEFLLIHKSILNLPQVIFFSKHTNNCEQF